MTATDGRSTAEADRSYRVPMGVDRAVAELRRVAGTQLDPDVVHVFVDLVDTLPTVRT